MNCFLMKSISAMAAISDTVPGHPGAANNTAAPSGNNPHEGVCAHERIDPFEAGRGRRRAGRPGARAARRSALRRSRDHAVRRAPARQGRRAAIRARSRSRSAACSCCSGSAHGAAESAQPIAEVHVSQQAPSLARRVRVAPRRAGAHDPRDRRGGADARRGDELRRRRRAAAGRCGSRRSRARRSASSVASAATSRR